FIKTRSEGTNRASVRWWCLDDRHVAHAGDRKVERAGDRGCGESEHVDLASQFFESLLVGHTKALLFVNDQESELVEVDIPGKETMGANDNVDAALFEPLKSRKLALFALEPAQPTNDGAG